MGLFSSIFGAKTKSSTTVNVPPWILDSQKNLSNQIGGYLAQDPRSFVAPASTLQTKAFNDAQNLGAWQTPLNNALGAVKTAGAAPAAQTGPASLSGVSTYNAPHLGAANQAAAATIAPSERINASSLLDNLGAYMDPATNALVNTSLATYNRQADQRRAAEQAKLAGNGAWGSGGQFYLSDYDQGTNMGAANLENQLRQQAWAQGLNASNMDAERRQGAAGFNAGAANTRAGAQAGFNQQAGLFNTDALNSFIQGQAGLDASAGQFNAGARNQVGMFNAGQNNQLSMFNTGAQNDALKRALDAAGMQGEIANNIGANQRADVGLTGALGEQQHAIDQAYAQALPAQLMNAGNMYGAMGLSNYFGNTVKGTSSPSPFQAALSVGSLFASDRRLKRNIVKVATKPDGLNVYEYDYVKGRGLPPSRQRGVMADEVRRLRPWALGPKLSGYDSVNYSRLEAA